MLIRHADPGGDAAACAAIYAPFVTDSATSFEERPPTAAEFELRISSCVGTHQWLVAELDGEAVGFAYGSPHRERTAYQWSGEVSVYIAPGHQRRGIGRALYGALLPLLARQGLYVVCAGVTLPNPASVGLHESLGFTPVGVYRRIGFKFGAWHDVGWWQLELRDPAELPTEPPGPPLRLDA